ncbi:MAG: M28 family peptidase [Blastocatellia bacterium]|nr:M28 family peptidase [Blastocatellia bacterium]
MASSFRTFVCWYLFLAMVGSGFTARLQAQQPAPPGGGTGLPATVAGGDPLLVPNSNLVLEHIRALTAPRMEGRRAGSAGDRLSAAYTAEQFRRAGLLPVGDNNTFFQAFDFPSWQAVPVTGLSRIETGNNKKSYSCEWQNSFTGKDFRPVPHSGQGSLTAEVVFVGYGLEEPELKLNDYAGVNVQGKIVLLLMGDGLLPAGARRSQSPIATAKAHGAKACLLAYPFTGMEIPDTFSPPLVELNQSDRAAGLPVLAIRNSVRDELLAGRGTLANLQANLSLGKSQSVATGITFQLDLRVQTDAAARSLNVVAMLPGTDPALKDETLVLVTYRDGYGTDAEGRPCLGANDNASGVAVMLETARLLAQTKPARSILFLAYGAEAGRSLTHQTPPGLTNFLAHPTVPLGRVAAVFQFDRLGLNSPERVALDNVTLFPELFLTIRAGLPELSATLVTGSVTPQTAGWPQGVPVYRLTQPSDGMSDRRELARPVLYPTEDTPDRLRLDTLRVYTGVLTRITDYLAKFSTGPLVSPYREHVEALYRTTTVDFMPTLRADFYRRAASVRRDYVTDVLTYVPVIEGKKLTSSEKRRRLQEEFAELRENLADFRSRFRPVTLADFNFRAPATSLAADNQVGVWLGLDLASILPDDNPAVTVAELKANGLQLLTVTDQSARLLATDSGLGLVQSAQGQGIWVLYDDRDAKRRLKTLPLLTKPVAVVDESLADDELKAAAEAGHLIVLVPPTGAASPTKEKNTSKTPDAAFVERLGHVLETVGTEHVVVSAPPVNLANACVTELAKKQVTPTALTQIFGGNFARFVASVIGEPVGSGR